MMHGSKEIFKNSPKLARNEHGKMEVSKKHQSEANTEDASAGHEGEPVHVEHEAGEMHARHVLDHHMLHAKHSHEHAAHKGGDKKEMHSRHHKELGELHKRHEAEMGSGREDAMTKGAKIENAE